MQDFKHLVNKSQLLFDNNSSYKNMWVLLIRYLCSYYIFDNINYIHYAYILSVTEFNKNNKDILLLSYITFLDLILENFDRADENINALSIYKKYFKNNNEELFGIFCFLVILKNAKINKKFVAAREFKKLEKYNHSKDNPFIYILLAFLSNQVYGYNFKTDEYLIEAFNNNSNNIFMYLTTHIHFSYCENIELYSKIMPFYIRWCTKHNIYIENFIDKFGQDILHSINDYLSILSDLYAIYNKDWILKAICLKLIKNEDYSLEAYNFYEKAVDKQIEIKDLNNFFVKSLYKNNIEPKNLYSIKLYIKNNNISIEMKAFIYHIILTNDDFEDYIEEYKFDIFQFGFYALEHKLKGKYYYSIYTFIVENEEIFEVDNKFINSAEEILYNNLFAYDIEIENKNAAYIWIKEKEKNKMELYNIVNGKVTINAVSNDFNYYLLDYENRNIIESNVKITQTISNADARLYIRYYLKDNYNENILISLSKYYSNVENPVYKCLRILRKTVKRTNISRDLKMRIIYTIGNIYYNNEEFDKTAKYYRNIDENYIEDEKIERLVEILININEVKKALDVLIKKSSCVKDKTIFNAVKKASENEQYHSLIANFAYQLLIKSFYDSSFVDIVIKNYNGSQKKWVKLSKVLSSMSLNEKKLDEFIIKNSIWLKKISDGIEEIFVRLAKDDFNSLLVNQFIEYLCYEIIINNISINTNTINILEKKAIDENENEVILYSLVYVYINQNITTNFSKAVVKKLLAFIKDSEIILPIFKQSKDKLFNVSYIRKNTSFIYRTSPDKKVILYYRYSENSDFQKKKMKYFKFGLYTTAIPIFFGDSVEYYIAEAMENGSIETRKKIEYNQDMTIFESEDEFFQINNAIINEKALKYDYVEDFIIKKIDNNKKIKYKLL